VRLECPTCKTVLEDVPDDYPPRPFCSGRCKLVDLHAWLNEEYRVSEPLPADADDDQRRLN
jgi:endogenous inhibitor of DNA gyrase (YacG/DUF329 family)